jgi:hypothetical protein
MSVAPMCPPTRRFAMRPSAARAGGVDVNAGDEVRRDHVDPLQRHGIRSSHGFQSAAAPPRVRLTPLSAAGSVRGNGSAFESGVGF